MLYIAIASTALYFGFNCFLLGQHYDYMLANAPTDKRARYWFYFIVITAVLFIGIPSLLIASLIAKYTTTNQHH